MQHLDPDRLALLALGERLGGADEQELTGHLAGCATCQQEVRTLQHTAQLAREAAVERDEEALRPGEGVWDGILAELRLDAGGPAVPRPVAPAGPAGPAEPPDWFRPAARPAPVPPPERRLQPVPARSAPRRRWVRTAAALVAAAAIGVLGTLAAVRPWQDRAGTPPPAASPAARLAPVPGGPGGVSGRAIVVAGAAGPELRLTTAGLPALNQGYYEVWVFDGGTNMVAVGVLGPGPTATLPLPPTLDLRTFAVVDISQEKYDGDQTHSETSVLRGTLTG